MATSIKSATMRVLIQESITINGKEQGGTTQYNIGGINETSRRILTAGTTELTAISLGSAAGAGTYIRDNVRYMRFTNLDDTNYVKLAITHATGRADIKLLAGTTFILNSRQLSVASPFAEFSNITSIALKADTAACDVELFVASV